LDTRAEFTDSLLPEGKGAKSRAPSFLRALHASATTLASPPPQTLERNEYVDAHKGNRATSPADAHMAACTQLGMVTGAGGGGAGAAMLTRRARPVVSPGAGKTSTQHNQDAVRLRAPKLISAGWRRRRRAFDIVALAVPEPLSTLAASSLGEKADGADDAVVKKVFDPAIRDIASGDLAWTEVDQRLEVAMKGEVAGGSSGADGDDTDGYAVATARAASNAEAEAVDIVACMQWEVGGVNINPKP